MFKKFAGIFLAAAVMCSTAAVSASAAESEDDAAVAATEQSGEVAATEESGEVSADASSETGANNVIYFDVNKSGWKNVKTVFCHIWKADGTGTWPSWQTKAERCTYDSDSGIATYDLSKTDNDIKSSDGNIYCVIFSANTGMQTYNTIMSGSCIGDTMYCDGTQVENPEDSEKKAYVAVWQNNPNCGPEKKITSTGNVVGTAYTEGATDTTLLADYLIAYYDDTAKTDLTQNLIDTLKLNTADVQTAVDDKLAATNNAKSSEISAAVKAILAKCKSAGDASSSSNNSSSNSDTGSNTGSNTSSNSSSSGSSSKTSSGSSSSSSTGSVKSGVESTIVFVAAGVMISAAGVMFLARKRKGN